MADVSEQQEVPAPGMAGGKKSFRLLTIELLLSSLTFNGQSTSSRNSEFVKIVIS